MASAIGQRMRRLKGSARLAAIGEVVEAFRASGKSRVAYCSDLGMAPVTLSRWESELEASASPAPSAPRFVELGAEPAPGFEMRLSCGTRVHVPAGFEERDLQRLLRALAPSC